MSGIVKVGTGAGQLTVPLIATWLIAAFGWRNAYLIIGALSMTALVTAAQVLRRDPQSKGLLPDGDSSAAADPDNAPPESSIPLRAAVRSRQLWTICLAEFAIFFCLLTVIVHIVPHATDLGLPTNIAAGVLATIGGVSMLGRIVMGAWNDRIGGKRSLMICLFLLLASLLWLQVATKAWMLYLFAVVYGLAHGGFFTVMSPMIAEWFGTGSHGLLFGIVLACGNIGGALGPLLADATVPKLAQNLIYDAHVLRRHGLEVEESPTVYHHCRWRPAVIGEGTDVYIAFVNESQEAAIPVTETFSIDLTCTNQYLPEQLRPGDINSPTSTSPEFAAFKNLTRPTPAIPPTLGGDLMWRLVSHLSLNYLSLNTPQAFRSLLGIYNVHISRNQQMARENQNRLEGIERVKATPKYWMMKGVPVRGMATEIEFMEDKFTGEGDLYLFTSVLDRFLALYSTMNSVSQLTARGVRFGEEYRWPPRLGEQPLL